MLLSSCTLPEDTTAVSVDTEITETSASETDAVTETEEETVVLPEETTADTSATTETEPETIEDATETDPVGEQNDCVFKADLSEYEEYLEPEDRDGYLLLVNPDNPLSSNYKPSDLTLIADRRAGRNDELRLYAAKALEAFLKESRENGCKTITSVSAYRPYNTQLYIFNNDVKRYMEDGMTEEEAVAKTRSDTAYPGESEHQSGLAVDILTNGCSLYEFEGTYEAEWLAENAWKFGFILRYPKGKEEITTYVYEPWHFRYVGRYHAKRIYDAGMCLEEYIEFLKTE